MVGGSEADVAVVEPLALLLEPGVLLLAARQRPPRERRQLLAVGGDAAQPLVLQMSEQP